jgi:hypothetical protein
MKTNFRKLDHCENEVWLFDHLQANGMNFLQYPNCKRVASCGSYWRSRWSYESEAIEVPGWRTSAGAAHVAV